MSRVLPTENMLSDEPPKVKKKIRNYSFQKSKRLPLEKMTEVNGIKIPSMQGSCYHAIIATLAESKDKFCTWEKVIKGTHYNMRKYGGQEAWDKFKAKGNVKSHEQRIKDNAHTLTRTGSDCYGYRLHEQGMCIYYFKDGAMLVTGGQLENKNDKYDVIFPDGKRLQTRYRGTTMTHKEYRKFLDRGFVDSTGKILDADGIKKFRSAISSEDTIESEKLIHVCVELNASFGQHTALRLEGMGLQVDQALGNELIGVIYSSGIDMLKADLDVKTVEVSGE